MKQVKIPNPRRFDLVYRGSEGDKMYQVSLPVEKTADSFTAYAFGKGIRTFKFDKVLSMTEIRPVAQVLLTV